MGLFSKPKIPSIDIGALQRRAEETAQKRRGITQGLTSDLSALNPQFEAKVNALGARLAPEAEGRLEQLGQETAALGGREREAAGVASRGMREAAFRDVPAAQRAIRESLGGSGLLNSGAAASTLARPTLDALRTARDFDTSQEADLLSRQAGRDESLVNARFNERKEAMQTKFGLDQDTINYLQSIGREDLIREAESLSGIEGDLGSSLLQTDMLGQQQNIARASANAARRGAIISSLGQFGGAALGSFGGPMGAAIGGQVGGAIGGFAGGGSGGNFDPTLLFALQQQQRNPTRSAVTSSLGRVPTYSPTNRQMGY